MNGVRQLGRLGVAIVVMIAGLVVGAAPARAVNYVYYQNVGNPGWCLSAGFGVDWPKLIPCGSRDLDERWSWSAESSGPFIGLIVLKEVDGKCLTGRQTGLVALAACNSDDAAQHWDVWGQNGWVVYQLTRSVLCMVPAGTDVGGQSSYDLELVPCPARNNVPNLFAWRYSTQPW